MEEKVKLACWSSIENLRSPQNKLASTRNKILEQKQLQKQKLSEKFW